MTAEATPVAVPAVDQLLDLAEETRPDIRRDDLHGAIIAIRTAGWPWPRILINVALMLAKGEEPRDLRNAVTADPTASRYRKDHP